MAGDEIKVPKVFISYSQDSPEHNTRVLALANLLVKDGIHCSIDQYEDSPPEGWQRWMERQILEADFVLIICSARYLRRVKGDEKPDVENGVRWESDIMYQTLYDAGTSNTKFIPVLFEGASPSDIPTPIKSATRYSLRTNDDYNKLYRRLTHQPLIRRPKTGELLKLSSIESTPDFLFSRPESALKSPQEALIRDSGDTSAISEQTAALGTREKVQEHPNQEGNTRAAPVDKQHSNRGPRQHSNTVNLENKLPPSLFNDLGSTKPFFHENQPAQSTLTEETFTSEISDIGNPEISTKEKTSTRNSANKVSQPDRLPEYNARVDPEALTGGNKLLEYKLMLQEALKYLSKEVIPENIKDHNIKEHQGFPNLSSRDGAGDPKP